MVVPPECRSLQDQIDGIDAEIRLLQEELQSAPPAQKPFFIQRIHEKRQERAQVSAQLDRCIAHSASYLRVAGVEDTQAVQFFDYFGQGSGAASSNSVPLVDRKALIIRVYVALERHSAPFPTRVSGTIEYTTDAGTFGPEPALNGPIAARVAGDVDRGRAGDTLNFRIPASRCRGRLRSAKVTIGDPGQPGFELSWALNPRTFREVPQLPLHGVLIHYTGGGRDLTAPTGADLVNSLAYLARVYPISGIQYTGCEVIDFDGDLTRGGGGCGNGWGDLLDELSSMRSASGRDDIYLGLLPTGTPVNRFVGCGRTGVCATFSGSQITVAHEIAHSLKRKHAPCGDPANVDDSYPDYDSYPSASIGEFGVNNETVAVKDPATTFDVMSYCGPKWVSPYTYQGIMDRLVATRAARATEVAEVVDMPEDLLHLALRVISRSRVELRPSYHFAGPRLADRGDDSPYRCALLDADGETLSEAVAQAPDPHQDPGGEVVDLTAVLPWDDRVAGVSVRRGETVVGTVSVPTRAPAVRLVQSVTTAMARADQVRLEWEEETPSPPEPTVTAGDGTEPGDTAARPGAGPTRYLLRYTHDGGESWQAVAANLTGRSRMVDLGLLPGGEHCRFQILATSGLHTSLTDTEEFEVSRKPRRAYLLAPGEGVTVGAGVPLMLRGGGFSPDAGVSEFDDVTWSSDRDGHVGTGYEAQVTLTPGRHRLTLTVPDGLGGVAQATRTVDVLPPA